MSVRYDLRLKTVPASVGQMSFSRVERRLPAPNATRT